MPSYRDKDFIDNLIRSKVTIYFAIDTREGLMKVYRKGKIIDYIEFPDRDAVACYTIKSKNGKKYYAVTDIITKEDYNNE